MKKILGLNKDISSYIVGKKIEASQIAVKYNKTKKVKVKRTKKYYEKKRHNSRN